MGFPVGTQVTVDNALKMMMVKSANDMAVLLAEGVDGSIENFADDMTRTAHRLGMSELNFVNPNGLPADGQITSARDLAILARALIHDFPEYNFYWHIPAIKWGRRVVRNYNTLLGRYPGADGMKTGFICASGFNLVATATRNGRQLIAVVLGSPSGAARAVKAAELLESGFTQNPLGWLTPALGTVDALTPINADPPNLHDQVCGPHRKRPAAEDEDMDAGAGGENGAGVNTPFSALLSSLRAPTPKGAALLSDSGAITPTVVYTGPTRSASESRPPQRHRSGAPPQQEKIDPGRPRPRKPATRKRPTRKRRTAPRQTARRPAARPMPSALDADIVLGSGHQSAARPRDEAGCRRAKEKAAQGRQGGRSTSRPRHRPPRNNCFRCIPATPRSMQRNLTAAAGHRSPRSTAPVM